MAKKIPEQLKRLSQEMLALLSRCALKEHGPKLHAKILKMQASYESIDPKDSEALERQHRRVLKQLRGLSAEDRLAIGHVFSSSLEIMNACENAYRSYRIRSLQGEFDKTSVDQRILFVLTAHPTEARGKAAIQVMDQLTFELVDFLFCKHKNFDRLEPLVQLLLKVPLAKSKKPEVRDEAEYIYTSLLKERNIATVEKWMDRGIPVYFRTWVGGDKDGHPGVDERQMNMSLNQSRSRILSYLNEAIQKLFTEVSMLEEVHTDLSPLKTEVKALKQKIKVMAAVLVGDGDRVSEFRNSFARLDEKLYAKMKMDLPSAKRIRNIIKMFPGLLVPLEMREDSALVHEAINNSELSIVKMLKLLSQIVGNAPSQWYVRGFILSMCESVDDYMAGVKLIKKELKSLELPVVPLFETRKALENSQNIVNEILANKTLDSACRKHWSSKFEIMLGYSDSAKENGSLASKIMISNTLFDLEKCITEKGIQPIFFHGSGGSVARGGGSIEEQISWWPLSAQKVYKATIQGEMVYRTFSVPEILERQIDKIVVASAKKKVKKTPKQTAKLLNEFSKTVATKYYSKIEDPQFLEMVEKVSPYAYLDQLKIGSRPSKRKKSLSLESLRAIPWVLCWTQNRVLFPVWWGLGSSWAELDSKQKLILKKAYQDTPVFRSFVNLCSYTLAKVDLSIFKIYLEESDLNPQYKKSIYLEIEKEYEASLKFLKAVSGKSKAIWFRPWLEESIAYRNTLLHPLNLLQITALEKRETKLLRECITGIASGMMTTG